MQSTRNQTRLGIQHIYDMNYLWGFAIALYSALRSSIPATETLLDACIYEDSEMVDSIEVVNDALEHTYDTKGVLEGSASAKLIY